MFYSSVHCLAGDCYSAEQLAAWAPRDYDRAAWAERLTRNRPWVAERDGVIVGYADLQADGYIDQFFVAAEAAGRGVGTALMQRILEQLRRSVSGGSIPTSVLPRRDFSGAMAFWWRRCSVLPRAAW